MLSYALADFPAIVLSIGLIIINTLHIQNRVKKHHSAYIVVFVGCASLVASIVRFGTNYQSNVDSKETLTLTRNRMQETLAAVEILTGFIAFNLPPIRTFWRTTIRPRAERAGFLGPIGTGTSGTSSSRGFGPAAGNIGHMDVDEMRMPFPPEERIDPERQYLGRETERSLSTIIEGPKGKQICRVPFNPVEINIHQRYPM